MDRGYGRTKFLISLFLIVITFAAFWQVNRHEFVNYDDNVYILENHHVRAGLTVKGVAWAFTSFYASNWHPLTWLSHMLDCELFGLNPKWHHLTNLIFHLANTVLLFLLLNRMTGALWRSAFVGILFALHPLHVESVAWVAERKDVLSTFFWMLTLWAYIRYVEHPGLGKYVITLLLFMAGLMSKPMLVTLPLILLILDYWPLDRLKQLSSSNTSITPPWFPISFRLVLEKIPLIVLSATSSAITIFAQQHGNTVMSLEVLPLEMRIANALVSYVTYIWKTIWPVDLAVFYPHPGMHAIGRIAGSGLLLLCIFIIVGYSSRKHPYLAVGWLWYFITLAPVIGVVQVGAQAMADRYTYIPIIGLFIIIAWGIPDILALWRYKKQILIISTGLVISTVTVLTFFQLQNWKNNFTLFKHALRVTDDNYLAHTNLGAVLVGQGKLDDGITHYNRALEIKPDYALANYNIGVVLDRKGDLQQAISHYEKAIRSRPNYVKAHCNLGVARAREKKYDAAISHFSAALDIEPDIAEAHFNIGRCLAITGKNDKAIIHFTEVVRILPELAQAHYALGIALSRNGRPNQGIRCLENAVKLSPKNIRYQQALERLQK